MAVLVGGPRSRRILDALLDTGADETVFEEGVATALGIDLTHAQERQVTLMGRTSPIQCRYATIQLRITDGQEAFESTTVAAFAATSLQYAILGYAGFLQFFDAEFRGADREIVMTPNRTFAGRRF